MSDFYQPGDASNQSPSDSTGQVPAELMQADSSAQQQVHRADWSSALRELAETILLTLVIFFLIRLVVENYRIEGSSMEPNFHNDQFLFVNKIIYQFHPPERGDVIIFPPPVQPTKKYIKRVIGLPGERVQIVGGRVRINDVELDERYQLNDAAYNFGPVILGTDEYFVLGDNRPESSDSHAWGPVRGKVIIGKAWVSYWPPSLWGLIHDYTYAAPIPKSLPARPNSPRPTAYP